MALFSTFLLSNIDLSLLFHCRFPTLGLTQIRTQFKPLGLLMGLTAPGLLLYFSKNKREYFNKRLKARGLAYFIESDLGLR